MSCLNVIRSIDYWGCHSGKIKLVKLATISKRGRVGSLQPPDCAPVKTRTNPQLIRERKFSQNLKTRQKRNEVVLLRV